MNSTNVLFCLIFSLSFKVKTWKSNWEIAFESLLADFLLYLNKVSVSSKVYHLLFTTHTLSLSLTYIAFMSSITSESSETALLGRQYKTGHGAFMCVVCLCAAGCSNDGNKLPSTVGFRIPVIV